MASLTTIVACARFKVALERYRSPALYEQTKGLCENLYKEILPPILTKMHWGHNELILDHGSGCGSTTQDFLLPMAEKTDSRIIALDNCLAMTEHAKENYGHMRIDHVCGELTSRNSPLKNKKFNKIFSLHTLHWVDDYREELKVLNEHLLDDGIMFMTFVLTTPCFDLYTRLQQHEKWGMYSKDHMLVPEWSSWNKDDETNLRRSFEEAGFIIQSWIFEERVHKYKELNNFADYVFSLNSFANRLPVQDYHEVKNLYRNYFAGKETKTHHPRTYNPADPYFTYFTTMSVLAKKM